MAITRIKNSPGMLFCLILLLTAGAVPDAAGASDLHWQPWSDQVFAQAKQEHKFVLLDLEAVWCHWCHVMDDVTYADPSVQRTLNEKYLLVKVDQDSRPDLSNRYEDYGWPATVVFDGEEHEIVRRQGYMPPKEMLAMLNAIIEDPSPGPSVTAEKPISFSTSSRFAAATIAELQKNFDRQYDTGAGGWGFGHKYLDADSVEYAMLLALHGNTQAAHRARATLDAERKLIDPVWGGAYQYSVDGNWNEPHYEKLISIQADVIRTYSLAWAQWHDPQDLKSAQAVERYVRTFLTDPDGAFYVSQDADLIDGQHSADYYSLNDSQRRTRGIPRVDKHLYARENGWMIRALCTLYGASGDESTLTQARRSAAWVIAHRALPGGGFHHGDHDTAGPYLGDTLSMGQAFLSLYTVTGDRQWLNRAEATAAFIASSFTIDGHPGFATSKTATDPGYKPHPERDENVALARFANLLWQYTGNAADRQIADRVLRYLATPAIALRPMAGSVLLAETESTQPPVHITIVGSPKDQTAAALFHAALLYPQSYKRIE
jgi:uncharacterized protein YyaL (SSP411 family)